MASWTNQFIDGMFSGHVNSNDGYAMVDCKDPRARRVLEFLVPLLYPEKPTRVMITVGNTIFGALSGERPVDWGIVVKDLVQRLLSGMGKSKATPICPYVFHLYHSQELLFPTEKEYRTKEALLKYNVESEGEDDLESPENVDEEESSDDSECESLTPSEIRGIQKQDAAWLKKSPMNKRKQPPAPKEPVANKRKSPPPLDAAKRSYQTIATACREIRAREREREALIQDLCKRLGNVQPDGLLEAINDLPSQRKVDELEAKSAFLQEKAKKVSDELKEEKKAHWKALDKLNLSLAFNQKLETYVGHTGDVVNEAQLLDANLAQNPVRELEEEERAAFNILTPTPPARIDRVQTGSEEPMVERMRELPTPPSGPTPEPISLATPGSLVCPSFLRQLETITKTPFKTPGQGPLFRLPISSPTPVSVSTDTQGDPEVSGSIKSADKGTETTSLAPRITRPAAKQTPGSSPRPKRTYLLRPKRRR